MHELTECDVGGLVCFLGALRRILSTGERSCHGVYGCGRIGKRRKKLVLLVRFSIIARRKGQLTKRILCSVKTESQRDYLFF